MKRDYSKLWALFKSMFVLSACTFGGGFVIVSLMKKRYVEELKWLEEDEMLDVTAITQSSPGPLPVNASVIFDVVLNLAGNVLKTKRTMYIAMMIIAFTATYLLDVSAMLIILTCLGIGLIDLAVTLGKRKGMVA